jgi:solute carrier family 10 (sodium/bile acid cotransporter), member 7
MPWLKKNWFLVGLLAAMSLGYLLGEDGALFNPGGWTNRAIVFVLFLITGLKLPSDRIKQDLATPRLHVYLQLFIFLIVPLYFLTAIPLFGEAMDGQLIVGVLALAVLPTTVSSCIVFTQNSNGNTVAAVFNAALANTAGIFISPLLLSLLLSSSGRALPASQLINTLQGLALNMLVPIALGQLARFRLREWAVAHGKQLAVASNVLILVIVLLAFARTGADPNFARYAPQLGWPIAYLMGSHLVLIGLVSAGAALLRLDRKDRITALFVGPEKTLALGAPLLTIFFEGQDILGVALLPLVIYHPWQLLVAGVLVSRLVHKEPKAAS